MSRFMGLVRMEEGVGTPPQSLFTAMDAYIGERAANGVCLDGGGLYGTEDAVNFVVRQGEVSRVDGPYAEAKELFSGFWIIEVSSKEEAAQWASQCPLGKGSKLEVRRVHGSEDFPQDNEWIQKEQQWREELDQKSS